MKRLLVLINFLLFTLTPQMIAQSVPFTLAPVNDAIPPPAPSSRQLSCQGTSPAYNSRYGRIGGYLTNANTPTKVIKIAFHFFQDPNNINSWWRNDAVHIDRLNTIVNAWMNPIMASLTPPSKPISGVPFISNSKIQYEVTGIYFYQNSALHVSIGVPQWTANDFEAAISAVDPARLNSIPICVTAGTITNPPAWGFGQLPSEGYLELHHFVVTTIDDNPVRDYSWAMHFLHELGHNLDLLHTYEQISPDQQYAHADYLSDIYDQVWPGGRFYCIPASPPPAGYVCIHHSGNPYTEPYSTNNMLGATEEPRYLSPLQIGKINRALAIKSIRRYVKEMESSTTEWVVNSNETWDFDIQMYQNIFVTNGATLTLKCKVGMANHGKITVDRGAKLVIDGGEVYAWGSNWTGIEVWGSYNKKQSIVGSLSPDHGIVKIINEGTLRDAFTCISTIKIDASGNWDWRYTGGIIQCYGAKFINNGRVIQYLSYHNKIGTTVYGNMGYIYKSLFETNNILKDPSSPNPGYFITMYDVEGVKLKGNTFQNIRSSLPLYEQRGGGILTIDASFIVDRYKICSCFQAGGVCPSSCIVIDMPTTFKNLRYGIYSTGNTPYSAIKINDNDFVNCNRGIYMSGIKYAIITQNRIDVGDGINTMELLPYGIYNNYCHGYQIEENIITTSVPNNILCQGVIFNWTGGLTNRLYNNKIDKMNCGVTVSGDNRGGSPGEGLLLKCNKFGELTGVNDYDIAMQFGPDFYYGIIDKYQGTPTQGANNKFSHSCAGTSDYLDYANNATNTPVFYFYNLDSPPKTNPLCFSPQLIPMNNPAIYDGTMCTSSGFNNTTGYVLAKVSKNRDEIKRRKTFEDGGDKKKLLTAIQSKLSDESLKKLLYGKSIYLSDDILLSYITRTLKPTAENIKDIIVVNSPVSPILMQKINTLNLPDSIQKQIKVAQKGVSPRIINEGIIADLNYEKAFIVDNQIRMILNDTSKGLSLDSISMLMNADNRIIGPCKKSAMASAKGGSESLCQDRELLLMLKKEIESSYKLNTSSTTASKKETAGAIFMQILTSLSREYVAIVPPQK